MTGGADIFRTDHRPKPLGATMQQDAATAADDNNNAQGSRRLAPVGRLRNRRQVAAGANNKLANVWLANNNK